MDRVGSEKKSFLKGTTPPFPLTLPLPLSPHDLCLFPSNTLSHPLSSSLRCFDHLRTQLRRGIVFEVFLGIIIGMSLRITFRAVCGIIARFFLICSFGLILRAIRRVVLKVYFLRLTPIRAHSLVLGECRLSNLRRKTGCESVRRPFFRKQQGTRRN